MNDTSRVRHTDDEDDLDGCGCGRDLADADATSDADLPPAKGGVEKHGAPRAAREGVA